MRSAQLLIVNGKEKGRAFDLDADTDVTIGRSSTNSIQINRANISRRHASVVARDGRHVIRNLGSRNGLFINGKPTEECVLAPGDEIGIGQAQLVYRGVDPSAATSLPVVVSDTSPADDALVTADISALLDEPEESLTHADPRALAAAHRRLAAVHEVGLAIHSLLDLAALLDRIVTVVAEKLRAKRCVYMAHDAESGELLPAASCALGKRRDDDEMSIPRRVLELTFDRSKAILSNDVGADERFEGSMSIKLSSITSVLAAPLVLPAGRTLGVLVVDTDDPERLFEDEDLRLLTTIGAVAATAIDNAEQYTAARVENRNLRAALRSRIRLIGESEPIQRVLDAVAKVGPTDTTILIRGETGTGKELVARALHQASPRREGPYIAVNCAALSESLLSSELFGHEKGAFTGAVAKTAGKFEIADGGTLFLDEIGEVSPQMQAKLLRVLQERTFERVGGHTPIEVDVRIVAATNRDLEEAIRAGEFRQDLYYRLSVVPLLLPPLRERTSDLPLLVNHFVGRISGRLGKQIRGTSAEAMAVLSGYRWPGNVRELQNVIERALVLAEGERLEAEDLPPDLQENELQGDLALQLEHHDLALPDAIRWVEKTCIQRAIKRTTKKVELARMLQISRPTLDKKLKEYDLSLDG